MRSQKKLYVQWNYHEEININFLFDCIVYATLNYSGLQSGVVTNIWSAFFQQKILNTYASKARAELTIKVIYEIIFIQIYE